MRQLGIFLGMVGMALMLVASAQAAPSGSITGAQATHDWTGGSVENLSVSFAECGSPSVSPQCTWEAEAVAVSAEEGGCPADELHLVGASDEGIWAATAPVAYEAPSQYLPGYMEAIYGNATLESGPIGFNLKQIRHPHHPFDEVCLYAMVPREWTPGCVATASFRCTVLMQAELVASSFLEAEPLKCPKAKRKIRRHGKELCVKRVHRSSHKAAG